MHDKPQNTEAGSSWWCCKRETISGMPPLLITTSRQYGNTTNLDRSASAISCVFNGTSVTRRSLISKGTQFSVYNDFLMLSRGEETAATRTFFAGENEEVQSGHERVGIDGDKLNHENR